MTVDALAQLIRARIVARAQQEPDPWAFVVEVFARLSRMTTEDELIALGGELGILSNNLETEN